MSGNKPMDQSFQMVLSVKSSPAFDALLSVSRAYTQSAEQVMKSFTQSVKPIVVEMGNLSDHLAQDAMERLYLFSELLGRHIPPRPKDALDYVRDACPEYGYLDTFTRAGMPTGDWFVYWDSEFAPEGRLIDLRLEWRRDDEY